MISSGTSVKPTIAPTSSAVIIATTLTEQWQQGQISYSEALTPMCRDLRVIEQQIAALESEAQAIRSQALMIARYFAEQVEIPTQKKIALPNLATVEYIAPTHQVSYRKELLDPLAARLAQTHPEIAGAISAARSEKPRRETVRITFWRV